MILFLLVGLLQGCSFIQNGDMDEEISVAPDELTRIRIVSMFGGSDPSTDAFSKQLNAYMELNPNVEIINNSMTSVGDEYRRSVKADFSTGNEADIVFFYTGADIEGIIEMNAVVPYEEIWQAYPHIGKDIRSAAIDVMREKDGNVYALPLTGFYEGLFVNESLFDQYGLALPTDWDKLMAAVRVFRRNDISPIAGPLAQSHYMVEHFIYARAGATEYGSDLSGDLPKSWSEGINDMTHFFMIGAFPENALALEIESAQQMFLNEEAAMIFEGSWFVGRCSEELQAKMTVLPMPVPPEGGKNPSDIIAGYSTGYYVSRSAYEDEGRREVVMDFLNHLTSAHSIKEIAEANGGIPSADVRVEGLSELSLDGLALVQNAETMMLPIDSRLTTEAFNHIIKEGIPYIVFNEKTAEEVLSEAKEINGK